jgi:hypothetical protein
MSAAPPSSPLGKRQVVRAGDLVCLARADEAARCRDLMEWLAREARPELWEGAHFSRRENGERRATWFSASVVVFPSEPGGYAFAVSDGDDAAGSPEISTNFRTEEAALRAAALSLRAMRETGSWEKDQQRNLIAKINAASMKYDAMGAEIENALRAYVAACNVVDLPEILLQQFDVYSWIRPDVETNRSFGWFIHGHLQFFPKTYVLPLLGDCSVLVVKGAVCPLESLGKERFG